MKNILVTITAISIATGLGCAKKNEETTQTFEGCAATVFQTQLVDTTGTPLPVEDIFKMTEDQGYSLDRMVFGYNGPKGSAGLISRPFPGNEPSQFCLSNDDRNVELTLAEIDPDLEIPSTFRGPDGRHNSAKLNLSMKVVNGQLTGKVNWANIGREGQFKETLSLLRARGTKIEAAQNGDYLFVTLTQGQLPTNYVYALKLIFKKL